MITTKNGRTTGNGTGLDLCADMMAVIQFVVGTAMDAGLPSDFVEDSYKELCGIAVEAGIDGSDNAMSKRLEKSTEDIKRKIRGDVGDDICEGILDEIDRIVDNMVDSY